MPSALYFLKSIFMWGNHSFTACGNVVMMCDEKKYNPQGGSLPACIVTQGRLRCTCQPCAIESITPMGLWYTVRLAWAIECTIGNGTPQCLMEMGRGGACVPARVALQGRIYCSSPHTMRVFLLWKRRYADVRAGTQAPPLRVLLERIARGRLMPFGRMMRVCRHSLV